MKLSESLRRGIMYGTVGGIINRFKLKRRRVTLFFEDILANYIKECENAGYGNEMREIGELWVQLAGNALIPAPIKKLPVGLFSKIMERVWTTIGILDTLEIRSADNTITINTKNEVITRTIGKNLFSVGTYGGLLSALFKSRVQPVSFSQSVGQSEYIYRITNEQINIQSKSKDEYNESNLLPFISGYSLEDALRQNIFQIKENRIYFRGTAIGNSENTLYHIIGNRNIMLDIVPAISREYFSKIIDTTASLRNKLLLLKTLLQVMGWGRISMIIKGRAAIILEISYPPAGLQSEKDNWDFLIRTILGYLWLINKQFEIQEVTYLQKDVIIKYAVAQDTRC